MPDPSRPRRAPGDWPYSPVVRELHQLAAHEDGLEGARADEVPTLVAHPAVVARLPSTGLRPLARALRQAIEEAISGLKSDATEAALLWQFGLASDSSFGSANARRARAAELMGYSLSQYSKERIKSGRWTPSRLTQALIRVERLLDTLAEEPIADQRSSRVAEISLGVGLPAAPQQLPPESLPSVLFVCALPSKRELAELHNRCHGLVTQETPGAAYLEGTAQLCGAMWRVALLATGRGNANAQSKTLVVLADFRPDYAFFLGCAGGFAHKGIKRGDLIVPRTVHKYQSAAAPAGDKLARPDPAMADKTLVNRIELVQSSDWFRGTWRDTPPTIHFEDIVSGDVNVKSTQSSEFGFIKTHYGQAVAVEMEGYGFLSAAQSVRVPAVVIRGISDQIDNKTERSDHTWQPRATAAATDLAFALLAHGTPSTTREPHGSLVRATSLAPDVFLRVCSVDSGWNIRGESESLGVKPCIVGIPGSEAGVSPYVERPVDVEIREAITSGLDATRGLHTVLVEGPSFSGKTRAAVEALHALTRDCALVAPANVSALEEWIAVDRSAMLARHAVVLFVDDLESFSPSRRFRPWFRRLQEIAESAANPIVLLATCGGSGAHPVPIGLSDRIVRDTRHIIAIRRAATGDARSSIVRIEHSGFDSPGILAEITERYDGGGGTAWTDLAASGNFLRALWAGPWLEERYRQGYSSSGSSLHARGQAIAWAAMLLRRVGCGDWPAPQALLEELHYRRLGGTTLGSDASVDEIEAALAWATQEAPDGLACLVQRRQTSAGHGYVSPAFLAERLLDEDDLPRHHDTHHFVALLQAHGAPQDVVAGVADRIAANEAQIAGADADEAALAIRVRVAQSGTAGTRGDAPAPEGHAPPPRGVDIGFSDKVLDARLRVVDGLVVARVKVRVSGSYSHGVALVVASSEEASAPPQLQRSTLCVDTSGGPAWRLDTGLIAPDNEEGWLQLADLVAILPLT